MDAERWQLIEVLFDQALACPQDERGRFVAHACGDDPDLHCELGILLASASSAGCWLRCIVDDAFRLLSSGTGT